VKIKRDGKEQIITGTVKFRMKRKKALRLQMCKKYFKGCLVEILISKLLKKYHFRLPPKVRHYLGYFLKIERISKIIPTIFFYFAPQ
jgi:hypothetical protein